MQKGFRGLSPISGQRQVVEQSLILAWLCACAHACYMRVRNSDGIGSSVRLGYVGMRVRTRGAQRFDNHCFGIRVLYFYESQRRKPASFEPFSPVTYHRHLCYHLTRS